MAYLSNFIVMIKSKLKQTILLLIIWFNFSTVNASFWIEKISNWILGDSESLDVTLQDYIANFLNFLYLIAVIFILYWAFKMFSALWDEEKFNSGKKVIIFACIWIIVIYLAWPIVDLLIWEEWILNEWFISSSDK